MDDRTQIAAMAMQGMLSNGRIDTWLPAQYAAAAREYADALIAALRETPDLNADFLTDFAAKQEPLGAEFEAAINADREGLYSDDPNDPGPVACAFQKKQMLDTLTAEAQDEVGDWRSYVRGIGKYAILHVAEGRFAYSSDAFFSYYTPQGVEFWARLESGLPTPAEEARARDFARRVLEAMEKEDD